VVVPENNSREKNAAMRALGAELIEHGHDFIAAKQAAEQLSKQRGLDMIPSFHRDLVLGVSTYAHELFDEAGELDAVYVPIGLGSGICGTIAARDHLGLKTEIIGVVPDNANAYALSFRAGHVVNTNSAASFAEGMAVREPHPDALAFIRSGASHVVSVSEDELADAVRLVFRTTHNVAEGAGAGALAALVKEKDRMDGKTVGVILSGGNIDAPRFAALLNGNTPKV
jgi:threonine dehydratase